MNTRATIVRTNATNADFNALIVRLDAELAITDGDDHAFYHQFNGIDQIKYVIVAYQNDIPVACGAIKKYNHDAMEIKRMYVLPEHRRFGHAMQILENLQVWAKELGFIHCILETGKAQPEAISLYLKAKFEIIENYGQYAGVANSICFRKVLSS